MSIYNYSQHVYLCYKTQLTEKICIDIQLIDHIHFRLFIASMPGTKIYNMFQPSLTSPIFQRSRDRQMGL